jgi:hypothetical protein
MLIPIGTNVTNARGWTGRIVERPRRWTWRCDGPDEVVYVHWKEREDLMNSGDREERLIKDPVVSAMPHKLTILS